jgi:hypothetical protein
MRRRAARLFVAALVAGGGVLACNRNPACPSEGPLATGRWTGDGACLSVANAGCNLAVWCGHGQFPRPIIRADGTFDGRRHVPHRGWADLNRAGTARPLLGRRDRLTREPECDAERILSSSGLLDDADNYRNVPHSLRVATVELGGSIGSERIIASSNERRPLRR